MWSIHLIDNGLSASMKMIAAAVKLSVVLAIVSAARVCIPRDFGYDGTVCVCNATYCDSTDPLPLFPPRQYYLFTSNREGLRFNLTKKNFGVKVKSRSVVYTLNTDVIYQQIEGFGGAFTDATGININHLSNAAQQNLLEAYFSRGGNAYTFGRIPIAGSDFSQRPYTYVEKESDEALTNFNLTTEDHLYKIPFIQRAYELTNASLRLLAAAWTAPPWMKTNEDYSGLGFLREEYYRTWSLYHLKFLEEYEKHGIRIWALSTGNEPINGAIPFFPFNCMGWTPLAQRKWVTQHFGPLLQGSRFNETLLLALDDQRFQLPWWLNIMFHKNEASAYISGVGVHWYWDHVAPLALLDKTHESYPDKFIISTEACFTKQLWETNVVHLGSWARGEQYAENIIDDLSHWVVGWIDWNLVLDESGGPNWAGNVVDAAVIVNKTSDEFYKQPMFYAIGHFSKFVPKGSWRVSLTGGTRSVKAIAFHTPQDLIVIVFLNKRSVDQAISVVGAPRGIANFVVPAKSIVTFICRDKKIPILKLTDD